MAANPLWTLSKALWALNVIAGALVAWRLYSAGLYRTYGFFFVYVVLATARSVALYPLLPRSEAYYRIWVVTQPVLLLFYILVVSELFSLVLKRYPGIYSLRRWFFFSAVTVSVIVSALTVMLTVASSLQAKYPLLYYNQLVERGIVTSLGIFLLLLLALVAWFAVPLSSNLLTHCCVYSAYFIVNNVIVLYWQIGDPYWSNFARLLFPFLCQCCWVYFLSPGGEARVASLHLGRSPLVEKRVLGQLETLNATLLRTVRK